MTLSINELRLQLTATLTKIKVEQLSHVLDTLQFDLCDLVELTFDPDPKLAFRAAWLLEHALLQQHELSPQVVARLLDCIKNVHNPSCRRHYAKIWMYLTSVKAPAPVQYALLHTDMEPVVEQCFAWVIAPEVLVAVKVHAYEALFNLRHRYSWIADELPEQLHYLMRNGSPAMQARGRKLIMLLSQKSKFKSQKRKTSDAVKHSF